MQLTKLEIKGFKSFADKVTINFDNGITGIVGPNGCGKSNVVDSIRWVLGEQKSRVLRSDKMENVIFNGTKNRKQTQLAEVSLTFENTKNLIPIEYNQVTITRRYYRSGESEYLLNGVVCRLKDITNLFMDTGIASNSYAIIELKMVDDLLNDKDNSRRSLFEEAAGISKFKNRKKETLKKLNDTDADLDRVEDLLFEIEKNLKSLERQAKQAKKYYEIKEEYKEASIALAQISLVSKNSHFESIEQNIETENDKKLALNSLIAEKEQAIQKAKNDLLIKEKTLASRQKTLNEHVSTIRQYESDKKIKNERQNFLNDKINSLTSAIEKDADSLERVSVAVKGLSTEHDECLSTLNEQEENLEQAKEIYENYKEELKSNNHIYQTKNEALTKLRDESYQLTKELEIKEIQLNSIKNELDKNQTDSSEHSDSLLDFETKVNDLTQEIHSKEELLNQLTQSENLLNKEVESITNQIEENKNRLTKINRQLDAKQNEFNLTKSLVDNLEGFPEAIKFLKKSKDWIDAPLLSDIIACPEEYRVSIENYLEPYMNHYVVQNMEEAIKGVELLSAAAMGKARFFILDSINDSEHSFIQPEENYSAIDLVDFDSKYEKLFKKLLGNVFLKEKVEINNYVNGLVFLEKEGKVVIATDYISGGSVGLFEGKRIGRAKNIEILDDEIKNSQKQKNKLQKETDLLIEELGSLKRKTQKEDIQQIQLSINEQKQTLASLESKQEQFKDLISTNQLRREDIFNQIHELETQIESLTPSINEKEVFLKQFEEEVDELKVNLNLLQESGEELSTKFNSENVNYHQLKNRLDGISREIEFKKETLKNTEDRLFKNKEDLKISTSSLNELVKNNSESDVNLVLMYEEKESLELGVNEAEKAYYEGRGLIESEEKNLRETHRTKEGVDQALMEWQNKKTEAQIELNSIRDRVSVEFNLDISKIDDIGFEKFQNQDQETLSSVVSKLREKIDRMGPINPMAVEAFNEIQERHEFINGQKNDLIEAKESLLDTISEIDDVAKETFLDAFDKIKDNFIKVFRTLFTEEDDCDLVLTEPDKPLESSIDIIAKPKGKKPLTINQLSGGEKTLTATSLLFSIYLLKPAPFCIFDEVDAPLDDANIDKFNEIIRKFAEKSQFIIVTHNKRTMASTDIIYGVTMQEQGVSKVIPVELRQLA